MHRPGRSPGYQESHMPWLSQMHSDLHDFQPQEYEERILRFFARHLRGARSKGPDPIQSNR
jgi:hypothetical protein